VDVENIDRLRYGVRMGVTIAHLLRSHNGLSIKWFWRCTSRLHRILFTATAYMLSALYAIANPSVRPSVTRLDQSKTAEVRIMQFSPYSSPIPLVLHKARKQLVFPPPHFCLTLRSGRTRPNFWTKLICAI